MIDACRSRPQRPRTIALALLACALALRLLIPAGWMPVADAQGLHLVLCSGSGPLEMPSAHAMHGMKGMDHRHHHDHSMPDHPCAFAGLGVAMAEPFLPLLALPAQVATVGLDHAGATVSIGRGLAAPPPPATGPPTLG
jgi:hypothetical protein